MNILAGFWPSRHRMHRVQYLPWKVIEGQMGTSGQGIVTEHGHGAKTETNYGIPLCTLSLSISSTRRHVGAVFTGTCHLIFT